MVALLASFALWSSPWAPSPARAASCLLVAAVGAIAAWGRWRGRAVDAWLGDISLFVINNYRLALNSSWTRWFERRPQHTPAKSPRAGPRAIVVIGRKPKARASTVTLELTACPARDAREAEMWPVTSPADYDQPPNASCVVVSVVAVEGCRVCFLDRRAGPRVSAPTPEDDCVPHLAASTEATFVASPDVAQVRELAEVIAREA